jgi:2-oxoacid:acceptor oxidoreductase gamma subunit (pyruvate/2-ketoisovalerate family)
MRNKNSQEESLTEIIIHGRGGQGAVTAAQILASAAFYDGKESQAFPNFGVERRGAPVQAFCRISNKKINLRCQVYNPGIIVVLDPTLMPLIDIEKLSLTNGTLIINTNKAYEAKPGIKVFAIDASAVAMEIFRADIVNTTMVAAISRFTGIVSKESMMKALSDIFDRKDVLDKNRAAAEKIFMQRVKK